MGDVRLCFSRRPPFILQETRKTEESTNNILLWDHFRGLVGGYNKISGTAIPN